MKIIDALVGILFLYGAYLLAAGVEQFVGWITKWKGGDHQ